MKQVPKLRHSIVPRTPTPANVLETNIKPTPATTEPQQQQPQAYTTSAPPEPQAQQAQPPSPASQPKVLPSPTTTSTAPSSPSSSSHPYPKPRRPDIPHNLSRPIRRDIVLHICERIAEGEFLVRITQEQNMPSPSTFRNWLRNDPEFARFYADALLDRTEWYKAETIAASKESIPTYKDTRDNQRADPAAVSARNMRVRALQWIVTTLEARLRELARSRESAILSPFRDYVIHEHKLNTQTGGPNLPLIHHKEQYNLHHPPLE